MKLGGEGDSETEDKEGKKDVGTTLPRRERGRQKILCNWAKKTKSDSRTGLLRPEPSPTHSRPNLSRWHPPWPNRLSPNQKAQLWPNPSACRPFISVQARSITRGQPRPATATENSRARLNNPRLDPRLLHMRRPLVVPRGTSAARHPSAPVA